jgi:putative Mg2+ transporter-C (MgtC) family protein
MDKWEFSLNIGIALFLGMAIGVERQWRQHTAGLRTNALVALGAALFVSLSILMNDINSPTRVASYVVSGVGFLGGGVILREGLNVKGLNTAATIWCSGAIGTLAGSGFPFEAAVGTATILIVHIILRPAARWIDARRQGAADAESYYLIRVGCRNDHEAVVRTILLRHIGGHRGLSVQSLATEEVEKDRPTVVAHVYAVERNDRAMEEVIARLSIEPDVTSVKWERMAA